MEKKQANKKEVKEVLKETNGKDDMKDLLLMVKKEAEMYAKKDPSNAIRYNMIGKSIRTLLLNL